MSRLLADVQQDLLDLGGELSIPGYTLLKGERVAALDAWLAQANAELPRLLEFIRPGGTLDGRTGARLPHGLPPRGTRRRRAGRDPGRQQHRARSTSTDSPT